MKANVSFFNNFRHGLRPFVVFTRDGHAKGYLWSASPNVAHERAQRIAGKGAWCEYAHAVPRGVAPLDHTELR